MIENILPEFYPYPRDRNDGAMILRKKNGLETTKVPVNPRNHYENWGGKVQLLQGRSTYGSHVEIYRDSSNSAKLTIDERIQMGEMIKNKDIEKEKEKNEALKKSTIEVKKVERLDPRLK
jgi:hypothetical protein